MMLDGFLAKYCIYTLISLLIKSISPVSIKQMYQLKHFPIFVSIRFIYINGFSTIFRSIDFFKKIFLEQLAIFWWFMYICTFSNLFLNFRCLLRRFGILKLRNRVTQNDITLHSSSFEILTRLYKILKEKSTNLQFQMFVQKAF